MLAWLSDPSAPAWVQAVGTIIALAFAIGIPVWQRSRSLRDARAEQARQTKQHLKRITAGLRAEIGAALEAADRQLFAIERTFKRLQEAQAATAVLLHPDPIHPGSMMITDAIVYRQIAAELGRFPSGLISSIVQFYTFALEIGRLTDGAPTALKALQVVQPLAPRLKMSAAVLMRTLDKFEAADFLANADLRLTLDEMKELAAKAGYPLEEMLRERGFQDPAGVRVER